MKVQLTEFECLQEAESLYKGYLSLDKAIKFLKFEKDWDVEVIEDDSIGINRNFCEDHNININHMIFMKRLQESGEVNMITESAYIIEQRLFLTKEEAKKIVRDYIENFSLIYNLAEYKPQEMI